MEASVMMWNGRMSWHCAIPLLRPGVSGLKPAAAMICAGVVLTAVSAWATQIHVSPAGHDAGTGTAKAPFRTVERAKAEVRKIVAAGLREAVTVFLHGGTYVLAEPLVFGPEDSGTEAFPVTYAACAGDEVVLSGGEAITRWRKGPQGPWTAEVPEAKTGTWFFRQLIVADRRAVRARWPDEDGILRIDRVGDGVRRFSFNRPIPPADLAGQGAELVVYEHWSITRGLITASEAGQVTTATPMGWIGHGAYTTASRGKVCYLEHARAFLDRPGEWFLDKRAGVLHYLPRPGEDPARTAAVAPRLERLVVIAGAKGQPVGHVHFQGLRFEHAAFPLPAVGYNEIQAAHYGTTTKARTYVRPVAIECTWAIGCRFERCRFAHLNGSGIGFGPGCRNNVVVGCTIEDIGGNGVMIGWRGVGTLDGAHLAADWKDLADAPVGNEVANCHIRRCGVDSRGGCGVFVAFSADTRIAHNHIHDMPYTGISIGFRWNTTPTTQKRCLVAYNHVHDVMKQLADGAGIYTLGFQPGTVLRGNHIHDVHRSPHAVGAPNNGFFIDQGSKGFRFEANVVHKTSGSAVRFNQSRREWHTWEGNAFGDKAATAGAARAVIERAGIEAPYRQP